MRHSQKPDQADAIVVGFDRGPWLSAEDHYSGDELTFVNRNYPDSDEPLFFTEHEWNTIEAAAARSIPTTEYFVGEYDWNELVPHLGKAG
ncbi:hypothetical protein [Pseudonocardia acidicola]|uniref:Uncharacterized protein n=1 Tax=Pseudonocardia acidicola TaxID=2724939 RepID=A0ABX1S9U6_9PSEU|nr:hypothetical protein [Pseudonocardia acidicola]NMH97875.1 hypothetical protein [Pseudonocardia acidicola]